MKYKRLLSLDVLLAAIIGFICGQLHIHPLLSGLIATFFVTLLNIASLLINNMIKAQSQAD